MVKNLAYNKCWTGILSLRVRDDHGGVHDFGAEALRLPVLGQPRPEIYKAALAAVGDREVRHVFSVPYTPSDLTLAMAVSDVSGAPLCVWIMDDQCVAGTQIPRDLMREFLEKCALRLTTHTELRDAYEEAFGLPFACLPAVVPNRLVRRGATRPPLFKRRGALLGSVWCKRWLDRLLETLGDAGLALDWYGNHRPGWLTLSERQLRRRGLEAHGIIAEPALTKRLLDHPYVVVPTGTLEGDDPEYNAVAALSLPGRILFAVAVAHVPVIVVGSPHTPASIFVARHGLGVTVPYEGAALRAADAELRTPELQARIRGAAMALAPSLSDRDIGKWLVESVARHGPADDRFERLFPRTSAVSGRGR